ncbi:hypothetical protein KHA90_23915 [Flavobacterium psychroterrae]|uniref:GLPGLI family protein n=1 Tax=Flavobacterium psychroterrae TaxID=2133767 RepID=A0ABS5PK14_9FLAO|nr:hypothetical protein [Flavobacterium psychroterrae]MBS7234055.1 hypothetical protein [Flavobacterium psychroterrae]
MNYLTVTMTEAANAFEKLGKAVSEATPTIINAFTEVQIYFEPYYKRKEQRRQVKKRFSIVILFLFSLFIQAQDLKYIKSLDSLNNQSARIFADQVVLESKTKFEFLRIDETTNNPENYHEVVYIPADAVNKEKKAKPFVMCDECIKVKFYVYNAGENKTLERKGTRALRFDEVSGRYLDIFPVWERVFKPGINLEKTIDDYDSRVLKRKQPQIEYRFDKNAYLENNWYIHNYS